MTALEGDGPTPTQRIVLVVAAVVLVGALLAAFLTSSLADGLMGRDDDGGAPAADTRSQGSSPTTTPAEDTSSSSDPGTTASSTPPSTAAGGADAEAAIGILRDYLTRCTVDAGLTADQIAGFTYDTTPADTPTRFYVTANESDGASATWTVEVTTRELVGADQLAQDILTGCPPG